MLRQFILAFFIVMVAMISAVAAPATSAQERSSSVPNVASIAAFQSPAQQSITPAADQQSSAQATLPDSTHLEVRTRLQQSILRKRGPSIYKGA